MPSDIAIAVAHTLATRVRILTVGQIAGAFFVGRRDPRDCTRRALRTLGRHYLVERWHTSLVEQLPVAPLWRGVAGVTPLDAGKTAWRNAKRWRAAKPNRTTCVRATERAIAMFAGSCRPLRPDEHEHDIAVSAVYLRLKSLGLGDDWRHEDAFSADCGVRVDAMYRRDGELITVEVLGRGYGKNKIGSVWLEHGGSTLELW